MVTNYRDLILNLFFTMIQNLMPAFLTPNSPLKMPSFLGAPVARVFSSTLGTWNPEDFSIFGKNLELNFSGFHGIIVLGVVSKLLPFLKGKICKIDWKCEGNEPVYSVRNYCLKCLAVSEPTLLDGGFDW